LLPHDPQFLLSVCVLVQYGEPPSSAQSVEPWPHAELQVPLLQTFPPVHFVSQPPQLFGSFFVSTHALPHFVVPPPQSAAHAPCEQTSPALHAVPHVPQLS
jgi:hypothetical protein